MLEGHEGLITSLAFDLLGETLASASYDKTVKLWDTRNGQLVRSLIGHQRAVRRVAFDLQGKFLASGSDDKTVKLWEGRSGKLFRTLKGHREAVNGLAFDPQGDTLASGSGDWTVNLWDMRSGKPQHSLEAHQGGVYCVAFDPLGDMLASGGADGTVKIWDPRNATLQHTLKGHHGSVSSLAFGSSGAILTSAGHDATLKLWDVRNGRLLRTLEGHTGDVDILATSPDGRLLASKSRDQTIRLWDCETWETVAVITASEFDTWIPALTFHPKLPLLADVGSPPDTPKEEQGRLIRLLELNCDALVGKRAEGTAVGRAVHHTTGKIVLVGDHSVGKSALGHRLIHGAFKEQASTHGQQFWVFPELGKCRADGTQCEAILWDFAGQPDYRLVHALFVDDADLALVLFDASNLSDPLHGVGFWLKQLQTGPSPCRIVLVAAQTDRGTCSLTPEELRAFCQSHGILGPLSTSAFTGQGVMELVEQMKTLIPWEDKATTVTTTTFKRIKDDLLGLKGAEATVPTIVTPAELRSRLTATDPGWRFTDAEMLIAVGHLENYGYVRRLRTSQGERRVLLEPERLNNLASSLVLEARRNVKGLGALEERRLLAGGYAFPELVDLGDAERDVLLDSAVLLFLEHNVCFRETDPLRMEPYLVFPELINLKRPPEDERATEDGVAYTASGPTENVFASLVVLLGYTHTFTRTSQWQNNARYEVGDGLVCGFRQEAERDGELDLVLCFCPKVGQPVRTLFQGLFEIFLARRNLTVMRYEPVRCGNGSCGHLLDRAILRRRMREGKTFTFCNECGDRLTLPRIAEPIQLSREL